MVQDWSLEILFVFKSRNPSWHLQILSSGKYYVEIAEQLALHWYFFPEVAKEGFINPGIQLQVFVVGSFVVESESQVIPQNFNVPFNYLPSNPSLQSHSLVFSLKNVDSVSQLA